METEVRKKNEVREIDSLKPHPDLRRFRESYSEDDIDSWADSIETKGRIERLDVLPNGVVLDDFGYVEALKLLGKTAIAVRVRHDLVGKRRAEVLTVMIRRGGINGRLSDIERTRGAKALLEEYLADPDNTATEEELRVRVARVINVTPRSFKHWERQHLGISYKKKKRKASKPH